MDECALHNSMEDVSPDRMGGTFFCIVAFARKVK
jgi:hypothetical protein